MRRPDRGIAAAGLALAGLLLAVPAVGAVADDAGPVELDGAVLRWGVNDESSNRAFAPDTYNFFSAGRVPDPGRGGTTLPRKRWRQAAGAVAIQKWDGTGWRRATWAGLRTDSAGRELGSPTSGTFSNHRFVFSDGTGEVDLEAGTAHVEWDGDVSVLYYSGMSLFHVSDPVLDVADGHGTVTATVQGYASSVEHPDSWAPVAAATVTLADLPGVELGEHGFTADPAYLGVAVNGVGQVATQDHFGSFPQSWVDYMARLGTAAFWMSSGASTDAFKVPLPMSVGFDDSGAGPEPTAPPTQEPIDNPVVPPPVTVTVSAAPDPATQPAPPAVVPPAASSSGAAQLPVATQLVAATPSTSAAPADTEPRGVAAWWLGGGLLLAAALILLAPIRKDP